MPLTAEQRTHLERAGLALVGVLLLVVGFSAGRYSSPAKVETHEVERWSTLDLNVEDITRNFTFAQQVEVTRWRNLKTKITATPDGGTVTEITDNTIEHEVSRQDSAATELAHRTEEHAGERDSEKTTVTTMQPDWRVGVQVGAALKPGLVITGPLVLGASVERRIVGGVSVGLWGNTVGAGGASVSIEF